MNRTITTDGKRDYAGQSHLNHLAGQSSPYLLQHVANPVDWYPWGPAAFERASLLNRPVFLSIGYSTCHWCHVMERESFEDPQVAAVLNQIFVCVKVDREERPDIDEVYMTVCQMMTGAGGWPLTIIMTPGKKPFFAGTYLPKESRSGRIGLIDLALRVEQAWYNQRDQIDQTAQDVCQRLGAMAGGGEPAPNDPGRPAIERGYETLRQMYDAQAGGFGDQPKFPSAHNLTFLLRYWKRTGNPEPLAMVETTLDAMRAGGLYDPVGYGFHRYATDRHWRVPHFEKMLYDQAMLTLAYLEAHQATGKAAYAATAREVLTYVLRDMTDPAGGFYSAEDADSEGEEGLFYLWTTEDIRAALPSGQAEWAIRRLGLTEAGNFEEEATRRPTGRNILYLDPRNGTDEPAGEGRLWDTIRQRLFEQRDTRIHPLKDDKILTDWNGLMIAALARAARVLNEPAYGAAAEKAASFLLVTMMDTRGRLLHRWRAGRCEIAGFLDDYAFLVWGLLELYEAVFDPRWLDQALRLARTLLDQFAGRQGGGLYQTAADAETLIVRPGSGFDGAIPSGNSVAMMTLLRLARLTGDSAWETAAQAVARAFGGQMAQAPHGFLQMLQAVDYGLSPSCEVTLAGPLDSEPMRAMRAVLRQSYDPNRVVRVNPGRTEPGSVPLATLAPAVAGHHPADGQVVAWVCRNFQCHPPVANPDDLHHLLRD